MGNQSQAKDKKISSIPIGETLNVEDVALDQRFNSKIDQQACLCFFKHQSLKLIFFL